MSEITYDPAMSKQQKKPSIVKRDVITDAQVRASVNRFLLSEVGSQFCAGEAEFRAVIEGVTQREALDGRPFRGGGM